MISSSVPVLIGLYLIPCRWRQPPLLLQMAPYLPLIPVLTSKFSATTLGTEISLAAVLSPCTSPSSIPRLELKTTSVSEMAIGPPYTHLTLAVLGVI